MPLTRATLPSAVLSALIAAALALTGQRAKADEKEACVAASDQAQTLRDEGKFHAARAQMMTCARDVCPGIVRRDCERWLNDLDASQPTVVLGARDPKGNDVAGTRVLLDGAPLVDHLEGKPIPIDPGEHVFRYETSGAAPVEQRAVIRVGEKNRILTAVLMALPATHAELKPPAAPPVTHAADVDRQPAPSSGGGVPAASIVFASLAVAGGASFAYFGITGRNDVSNLRATCAPDCAQSAVNSAHAKLIAADVSLGVGIVSLGAAVFFFLHRDTPPTTQAAVQADLQPRPGGGLATVTARF